MDIRDKEFDLVLKQAEESMGFVPNTLHDLVKKPNILGAFAMLSANVKGFQGSKVSPITGLKLMIKNMRWIIKAKKESQFEVPPYLKNLVGHMASNASGCRYCQAHTANSAYKNGVEIEKLQLIWEFNNSDLFSEKEKAAMAFALAAGSTPNTITPEHHIELKKHFTESQIIEIVATISLYGFLNRWNDSMATKLEEEPANFAKQHLSKNWEIGKHA
ncbi:carboxymuconolactone decarboxylase family protein [Lutimonas sp.]|uniref:carboxymuconolactone decarboxylase family protein n=1 Tax=Lutimonas sp. TaxID=1872403 RepID=UPI003D9AE568